MTLDELLAATREVASPDATTLARGRDAALAAVHQDLTSRARIARRRARRRVISVGAFAAAAAVVAFVAVPGGNQAPDVASPPLVEVEYQNASQIVSAAATAARQGSDDLGDAPYWKVVSKYAQTGSDDPVDDGAGNRTIWQGIDGPGVLKDTSSGGFTIAGGGAVKLPRATIRVDGQTYSWREINEGILSSAQIRTLLTAGEHRITPGSGGPERGWYIFKQVGELLAETPASPAVRQALWRELATLTGLTTSGRSTDTIGREGWNLTLTLPGYGSQRFIVDPDAGAILQAEVDSRGSTFRVTYLEAGPADAAPTATSEMRMPAEPAG